MEYIKGGRRQQQFEVILMRMWNTTPMEENVFYVKHFIFFASERKKSEWRNEMKFISRKMENRMKYFAQFAEISVKSWKKLIFIYRAVNDSKLVVANNRVNQLMAEPISIKQLINAS